LLSGGEEEGAHGMGGIMEFVVLVDLGFVGVEFVGVHRDNVNFIHNGVSIAFGNRAVKQKRSGVKANGTSS
jgi:hypothetical protein